MDSRSHIRLGLLTNLTKHAAVARTREVLRQLHTRGLTPALERSTAVALGLPDGLPLLELVDAVDVILVLGGDGTILQTARQLGARIKPLAGINTGRLGFLTAATESEILRVADALRTGEFQLSERRLLQVEWGALRYYALNEATVTRGASSRLVRLAVTVNGCALNRYSGDGLIVATPTGSTAYSLSAGGPILSPDAPSIVVTPICPHALGSRPIVLSDDCVLEIRAESPTGEMLLTVDGGQGICIQPTEVLRLRRADHTVPLITLPGTNFYSLLQEKLRWMGTNV